MNTNRIIFLLAILFLVSCQKDYYFDGGLSEGQLNMTTYDFLKSRPDEFSKLIWIIDQNNLKDVVNTPNSTFFVPKDASIDKYLVVKELDKFQFSKLPEKNVLEMGILVKSYIVPEKLPRANITVKPKSYKNFLDETVQVSFQVNPYNGVPGYGPKYVLYTKIETIIDPDTGDSTEIKNTATVSTSDLVSTNGIVHVLLSSSHTFGH